MRAVHHDEELLVQLDDLVCLSVLQQHHAVGVLLHLAHVVGDDDLGLVSFLDLGPDGLHDVAV